MVGMISATKHLARFPLFNNLLSGYQLSRVAEHPAVRQRGWEQRQLLQLLHSSTTIARNFADMTNGVMLDVVLTHNESAKVVPDITVVPEEKALQINLAGQPEKVISELPLCLSYDLVALITSQRPLFPGVSVVMPQLFLPISQGAHQVSQFLKEVRSFQVDEGSLGEIFTAYSMIFGQNVAKQRLAFDLLASLPFPQQLVGAHWAQALDETEQNIRQSDLSPKGISIWETMARVAAIGVVAERVSLLEFVGKCHGFLEGDIAQQLSYLDFLQLSGPNLDHYAQFPHETNRQLALSLMGLSVTYNAFRSIFDHFYNSVTVLTN
jgi:hypothetical protein